MLTAATNPPSELLPSVTEAAAALRVTVRERRKVAPMRSLFWRIFLWFWLAALLLAGAVTATVYITDPDQFFPRSPFVPLGMIDRLGGESVAVFEQSGPDALRDHLAGLPNGPVSNGLPARARFEKAYLFDAATGRELAGQSPRRDPQELVARAAASADLQLERYIGRIYMAHAIPGGAGSTAQYVFLLSMPRSSLLLPTTPQASLELAAALIISALVCYWLARYVVFPLRQLQAATRKLAEGDLGTRVGATGILARRQDEFSVLANDFDEMAARIEDLLNAQKRLIADISHELGTPLTRLNVALSLAFRKLGDGPRPELERIQTEAGRLNELIRQLLLISELEIHGPTEPPEPLDLLALITEVAADAEFEAGERRCRVRVQAASPIQMSGVRHLLRSAVENVVRNAIRYTAADSEVVIELDTGERAGQAVIRIRDQGPGVPEAELPNLFRPFHRVSEARDRLSGGTGLGLAITQQAVEAHGGSVRAVNQSTGGLLVEIELPAEMRISSFREIRVM